VSNVGCGVQPVLLAAAKFIAHLVNQQVAHEILALELLTILLDKPTDDSVEVSCDHTSTLITRTCASYIALGFIGYMELCFLVLKFHVDVSS
jgi:hypothetical protein